MDEKRKYIPRENPDNYSDLPNISGFSPKSLVSFEEASQRAVAENPNWLITRDSGWKNDTKAELEAKGFKVLAEKDDLFFEVEAPEGWTKSTDGLWTTITDADGNDQMSQFYKGASYDRRASLSFLKKSE